MRALLIVTSVTAGALGYHTLHRYGPALLWWVFSRGDR